MGHADPPRAPRVRARHCRPTRWARGCPARGSGRPRLGPAATRCCRGGAGARAPGAQRRARARRPGAARPHTRRDLAPAGARGHLPAARVPAPRPRPVGARDRARCSGSSPSTRSSRRPATSRSCWSPRARRRTPSTACCARRWRGWPASPCGCWPPPTGVRPPPPLAVPANARVVDWLSYARTMPRCAAVICHAGHGTVARALACGVPVVGLPRGGRHGRERGPAGLGGLRGVAAAAAGHPARGAAGGAQAAGRAGLRAAGAGAAGRGRSATTEAQVAAEAIEALA